MYVDVLFLLEIGIQYEKDIHSYSFKLVKLEPRDKLQILVVDGDSIDSAREIAHLTGAELILESRLVIIFFY